MAGESIQQQHAGSSGSVVVLGAVTAIGLSNVWRLPVMAGENGGWLFFVSYIAALVLMAWPLLTAELLVGKLSGHGPTGAFKDITADSSLQSFWGWIGLPMLVVSVPIAATVALFTGWTFAAAGLTGWGLVSGHGAATAVEQLGLITRSELSSFGFALVVLVLVSFVVARVSLAGVQRMAVWSLSVALLMTVILLGYALTRGAVIQGPDVSMFDPLLPAITSNAQSLWQTYAAMPSDGLAWKVVLEGVRQAFFTLGIGLGVMIVLGSLMTPKERPNRSAAGILIIDSLFTLLAGAVLLLLVSDAERATVGVEWLFERLPQAVGTSLIGRTCLAFWYLALAAMTWFSVLMLAMPAVAWARRVASMSDTQSSLAVVILIAAVAFMMVLALPGAEVDNVVQREILTPSLYEQIQWLCTALLVPLNGLLICLFVSRMMPAPLVRRGWGTAHGVGFLIWTMAMRYPVRVLVIVLLLSSSGLLDRLVGLWVG